MCIILYSDKDAELGHMQREPTEDGLDKLDPLAGLGSLR